VAEQAASRLLRNVEVAVAIVDADAADLRDLGVTAAEVLREVARVAFSDVRGLFDEAGALRPIHALSDDLAHAIAAVDITEHQEHSPDGGMRRTRRVRLWDKVASLKLLAQYLRLLEEQAQVTHTGEVSLTWGEWLQRAQAALERRRQGLPTGPPGPADPLGPLRNGHGARLPQGEVVIT
jgi:phage terminase small subunit